MAAGAADAADAVAVAEGMWVQGHGDQSADDIDIDCLLSSY